MSIICILLILIAIATKFFVGYKDGKVREYIQIIEEDTGSDTDGLVISRRIETLKKDSEKLDSFFVDNANAVPFIEHIEQFAEQSGVQLQILSADIEDQGLSKDDESSVRTHGELQMSITARGTWEGVISFLIKVENLPHAVNVEAFRISAQQQPDGVVVWNGQFEILAITN